MNDQDPPKETTKKKVTLAELPELLRTAATDQTALHHYYGISAHAVASVFTHLADLIDGQVRTVELPPVFKRPKV